MSIINSHVVDHQFGLGISSTTMSLTTSYKYTCGSLYSTLYSDHTSTHVVHCIPLCIVIRYISFYIHQTYTHTLGEYSFIPGVTTESLGRLSEPSLLTSARASPTVLGRVLQGQDRHVMQYHTMTVI